MELGVEIRNLKARNDELEASNQMLTDQVSDLAFEVALLRDVCDVEEEEKLEAEITRLNQVIADRNIEACIFEVKIGEREEEIATLKATIVDKDAEIENLKQVVFQRETELANLAFAIDPPQTIMNAEEEEPVMPETVLDTYNQVFSENPIKPPEPKKRVRVYKYRGPRVYNDDGTISRKKPGARKYTSKRKPVTNRATMVALKSIYKKQGKMTRCPGLGHDYKGVRYAQYYGRLNQEGDIGTLKTIILSSEKKVYQLNEKDKHVELLWQNDPAKLQPSYGTINLIGEGGGYQCSIVGPFKTELSVYL